MTVEEVQSEVWPVGVIEPWLVVPSVPWVEVVTEPEVEAAVWVVAVMGPSLVLVTEPWVELVTDHQVVVKFGSAILVVVVILP